jgi:hypothetical protein
MTQTQITAKILHRLGNKLVKVELDTEDWDEIFDDSYRWWVVRKGLTKRHIIALQPGVSEYPLPADFNGVIEYVPPGDSTDPTSSDVIDPFDINAYMFNYGNLASSHALTDMVLTQMYSELVDSVYGGDDTIQVDASLVDATTGWKLYVSPVPAESRIAWLYYNSETFGEAQLAYLKPADLEIFLEVVEAHAKLVVGRKRSKFTDYAVPGGIASLDGQNLIDEAEASLEALQIRIDDSQPPFAFITG